MLNKRLGGLVGVLLLAAVMSVVIVYIAGQSQAATAAPPLAPDLPYREAGNGIDSPSISFIDSPNATCSRPVEGAGACYIAWNYLYVSAATSAYVISMTVSIDNQLRAYHSGFFQTSMYIPGDMIGSGFKVTCGTPGSGGKAGWGKIYNYTIRARETGGLTAANYGSVTCPADTVKIYLPSLLKN
ncbi:MAG: hypothetical protein H6667_03725 [Ardenticatenaceae bacterium]|nr:hypothetical protein [Ardenticatenaceae bacterium]